MFPEWSLQLWFKGGLSCYFVQVHCWWLVSVGWHQSLCWHMLMLNFLMFPIIHLESFTLAPGWLFWLMPMGEHIASHWSSLEESCLPHAGQVPGNLLIVAILHYHSLPELVQLGWRWYFLPKQCICLYTVECPSLLPEWGEEVGYDGGSVIDHAHLLQCTKVHHLQLDVPLHLHVSSHQSLIFLFPWYEYAFTRTRSPGSNEMPLICLS